MDSYDQPRILIKLEKVDIGSYFNLFLMQISIKLNYFQSFLSNNRICINNMHNPTWQMI